MTIKKVKDGDKLTVKIEGRVDTLTAPELDKELSGEYDGLKELVLDVSQVDYISSAGLRVFLMAQRTMNKQGEMTVSGANQDVIDIFEATGFDDILTLV